MFSPNSYAEALTPNVVTAGDRVSEEVIKIQ